jgi:hypothetical protein
MCEPGCEASGWIATRDRSSTGMVGPWQSIQCGGVWSPVALAVFKTVARLPT